MDNDDDDIPPPPLPPFEPTNDGTDDLGHNVSSVAAAADACILIVERLCFICERTKWPAANADNNDNSPANTVAQTICANSLVFSPGA